MWLTMAVFLAAAVSVSAGQYDASLASHANYQEWGWEETCVLENNIITCAVVPAIGARVMQYDLGDHASLWFNDAEKGKTKDPSLQGYRNFGGFRNWPAPQAQWGGWPPPPQLDYGAYEAHIVSISPDSAVLSVESPVENVLSETHGLRFKRVMTIYRGSSRIRMEQRLLNTGSAPQTWGIWGISQCWGTHQGGSDYNNFWVYFAQDETHSKGYFILSQGETDAAVSEDQLHTEIRPGITGLQYAKKHIKVGAHTRTPWIAYVDQRDGYTYARKFDYVEGATYPDSGSVVQVFCTGSGAAQPPFVEIEEFSPVVEISPGDSLVFVVDWYAARTSGPIAEVNHAGAVHEPLTVTPGTGTVAGTYGVFHVGHVELRFNTGDQAVKSYTVSPLEPLTMNEQVQVPSSAGSASLLLFDSDNRLVDTLDTHVFADIGASGGRRPRVRSGEPIATVRLPRISVRTQGRFTLRLMGLDGTRLDGYTGTGPRTVMVENLPDGVCVVQLLNPDGGQTYCRIVRLASKR